MNFGLKTRIFSGFGVLVVLGLVLAGFAVWQLSSTKASVGKMVKLGDNVTRVLELTERLEVLRRANLRYTVDADDGALKDAAAAEAGAIELLQEAARATLSDERRKTYNRVEAGVESLKVTRASLMGLTKQMQTDRAKLFGVGDELSASTARLMEARAAISDPAVAALAEPIETAVLLVRVANWRFLATRDPKGPATFKANSEKATLAISAFEKSAIPDSVRALVVPVKTALGSYVSSFESLSDNMLKSADLYDKDLRPLIIDLQADMGKAKASLKQDYDSTKKATDETIDSTITLQELLAALALLLGSLIAFFVGRSIIKPVAGMTGAMAKLAAGDSGVEIPSRDSTDEIGAMAKAVEVFKQNAIERIRLEAQQKEIEARSIASRKADMHRLADSFETAIGSIIESVSSSATELEAAATTLTGTADTTQRLSTTVAGASEEASANVQSVATATEELSGSVDEIARQVHESSRIAGEAVRQAQATNARINELSKASSRIGEAVKLITAIAEQTNLLALNATIEAARAGEAGRGFAVVASEVKALASQTAKATDEIGSQITGIQVATQESINAIKEIGATIDRMSEIASAISAAVEEQGAATQEISRNVQQAASGTTLVASNIGDVSKGASETGSASSQVLTSARSLSSEGNRLKVEVDKFLSTVRAA